MKISFAFLGQKSDSLEIFAQTLEFENLKMKRQVLEIAMQFVVLHSVSVVIRN